MIFVDTQNLEANERDLKYRDITSKCLNVIVKLRYIAYEIDNKLRTKQKSKLMYPILIKLYAQHFLI